ncbi:glucosaminidase domain-containing protein [Desulfovermiculus halophilus]|jgi:Bax protein|uniref:glucosaminidase domain-containing protein n=1 Tax=Desulfovermiculus halophilus TaxID=339722 RepID=UPI000685CB82|nr:glucosaminidase domain-containing protein [Desulfovermiculus halophilus]
MPKKMSRLAAFILCATVLLFSCQQDRESPGAEPDQLIGQVQLPGLDGEKPETNDQPPPGSSSEQVQDSSCALPSVPDQLDTELPDFSKYRDVEKKKQHFFDFLRPIVRAENRKVLKERIVVLAGWKRFEQGKELSAKRRAKLNALARKYRVDAEHADGKRFFRQLLMHVDKVPVPLALVQAAKESGWGTSYFARKGNNLFGQWCFSQGCGLVPRRRPQGANYEVQSFEDVSESVQSYIHNLNSNPAYEELRKLRYRMRLAGKDPDAQLMAEGLENYSQVGRQYIEAVQKMIRGNEKFLGIHGSIAAS